MNDDAFLNQSRQRFVIIRWMSLLALAVLPFTFKHGPVSATIWVWAIPVAALYLASFLLVWRTQNELWGALAMGALLLGSRWSGVHADDVPFSQFAQWLCAVLILAGAPLLLFRDRVYEFARLNGH